jgi:hypothetical protein
MWQGSTSNARPSDAGPSGVGPSDAGPPDAGAGPSGAGPSAPSVNEGAGPSAPLGQPARTPRRRRIPQGTSIRRRPRERRMSSVYKRQPMVSYLLFFFFVTLSGLVNSYLNTC